MKWLALGALVLGWGVVWGCSSTDDATPADASDAGGDAVTLNACDRFTDAGDLCPIVTTKACFPMCATGGCFCLEGPNGSAPRWTCQIDESCLPDSSPLADVSFVPDVDLGDDAGGGDGAADAGSDGSQSDAGDGGEAGDASDAGAAADAADAADASG